MEEKNHEKVLPSLDDKIKKIEDAMRTFLITSRYDDMYKTAELKTILSKLESPQNEKSPFEERIAKIIFETFFNKDNGKFYEKRECDASLNQNINSQIGFSFMDIYYQEVWGVKWFCKSFFDYTHFDYGKFIKQKPVEEDESALVDFDYDFLEDYAEKENIITPEDDLITISRKMERLEELAIDLNYNEEGIFEESIWERSITEELFEQETIDENILEETIENFSKHNEPLDNIALSDIEKIKNQTTNQFIKSKRPNPEIIKKFKEDLIKEEEILFQHYKELQSFINKGISRYTCPRDCNFLEAKDYFEKTLKLFDKKPEMPLKLINKYRAFRDIFFISPELAQNTLEHILKKLKIPLERFDVLEKHPFLKLRDVLDESIYLSDLKYKTWKQEHKKMNELLKKRFPLKEGLTYNEYYHIYKDLQKFRENYSQKDLSKILDRPWISNAYNHAMSSHLLNFIEILRKREFEFKDIISKLYVSYIKDNTTISSPDLRKEIHYLNKAIKIDPNNLEAHHTLAKYYEKNSDRKKALETWAKLVKLYFAKTEEKNLKNHKSSTNEVGSIESCFFEDLILKKGKTDLSREYEITEFIYNQSKNKEFTSEPIALIKEPDGTFYIILRKADSSRTLGDEMRYLSKINGNKAAFSMFKQISEENVIGNFKLEYFKKVIDSLIKTHEIGKGLENKIGQYDYETKLKTKLEELFPENKEETYNNYSFLIKYLKELPQQFGHCDFYPENILVLDLQAKDHQFSKINKEFCTIDYEKSGKVNRYFDLTYLLEQAQLEFSSDIKEDLIKYFKEKIKDKIPLEKVMEIYNHNALFINLSLAGTASKWASKGEEYTKRKKKYLIRAKELANQMKKV